MEQRPNHEGSPPSLHFFTSAEVAEILKMHPQVITRKLQAGEIGGYKLGKDWRVSEAQLHEFLARHSNQRAQDAAKEKSLEENKALKTPSPSKQKPRGKQ